MSRFIVLSDSGTYAPLNVARIVDVDDDEGFAELSDEERNTIALLHGTQVESSDSPKKESVPALTVTALPDVKYDGPIPCPDPACEGRVMEIDTGVRFNTVYAQRADGPEGEEVLAYAGLGQSDFEHDRYACSVCFRTINMPEGFEIQDWS